MADKKISELTALTTPDGAEELVVNDGGTSKKITIDNIFNQSIDVTGTVTADGLTVDGHINITDGYEFKWGGSGATIYGSHSSNQLRLYTNNTERMRIDSSGKVGIGTESPGAPLHVAGHIVQGNSDSTPRTLNIPYSNTSGVLTYTFNWTDLALATNENPGASSDNAFVFEVNVTCYSHRYIKALITVDTNLDNSLSLTTLSNSGLTMTASIPTNSENITINVSNMWGNDTNYMGRITTF